MMTRAFSALMLISLFSACTGGEDHAASQRDRGRRADTIGRSWTRFGPSPNNDGPCNPALF